MRTFLRGVAFVAALVPLGARPAAGADGRIGVYSDITATQTSATFSIGVPRTLYIVATLDGQTAGGMTSAEFRLTGLPADWSAFVTPNPAASVILGHPIQLQGGVHRVVIAFPACQANPERRVLLYTVVVIANSTVPPGDLQIQAGLPPSNPNFPTPLFTLCDPPEFTKIPVEGGTFQYQVRAAQDLFYSEQTGYDGQRGVTPILGMPGDLFHFRVMFAGANEQPPAAGSPRLELDANGDGDALDPGEGIFTMTAADLDSTIANGKAYRYDVALGEPPDGQYHYRFSGVDSNGMPIGGEATVWLDALFVSASQPNLRVRAEDIRTLPPNPRVDDLTTIVVPIENRSERRVENVRVRIETHSGQGIDERVLPALGARSTTEIAANYVFREFGFQPVVVRIDHSNSIDETDETDNVASHGVYVGGGGIAGQFTIGGLPPLASVPPVAPFGLAGDAVYSYGLIPQTPVRGARVTVRPSWQAAFTTWTDEAGDFSAALVPPEVPGLHRVAFVITDGAHTDSAAVDVQVTPLAGQLPPHAPNLVPHLSVALGAGCPATTVTVSWSVENRGDRDSAPTTARLLADGVTSAAEVAVGVIAPGATATLGAIDMPVAGARLHSFTMHVDPSASQRELREDDNAAIASVHVPVACLDLALDRVRFVSDRFCNVGDLPIAARVVNRGCVPSAPARVALIEASELGSAPLAALAPGQSVEVQVAQPFPLGCHNIRFEVDPEGAAGADCDPTNDVLASALCIDECAPVLPANLRVDGCDVRALNSSPAVGEAVQFEAVIHNIGPGATTLPSLVSFLFDGELLGGATVEVPPLANGQSLAVQSAAWPADFEVHQFVVVVDPNGQPEIDASNNTATRVLPFDLRPLAIAACAPANPAMFSMCPACRSQAFEVRAVVLNDGLFACEAVVVEFRDQSDGNRVLGSVVTDVPAGNSCPFAPRPPVTAMVTIGTTGAHFIATVVDPAGDHLEADETNNEFARQASVAACVSGGDLVAAVQLPAGTVPRPGDTITAVEVRVTNNGPLPSPAVQGRLTLDGSRLCDFQFGDLQPNESRTQVCTTPWVVDSTLCQRLEACADPDDQIIEPNESNNCAAIGIASEDTDLAIFPERIHVTPPNPAPNQQVLIEVDIYNFDGVETSCRLKADWQIVGLWIPIADIPLLLPAGQVLVPSAGTFVFSPPILPVPLRFRLENICPPDRNSINNVVFGSLPWFDAPGTPIAVRDLVAASGADGVHIRWRAEPGAAWFAFDRRSAGDATWQRLPQTIPAAPAGTESYEFVDRDAEPGTTLEYRLVGRLPDGSEEMLGTLLVEHAAAAVAKLQLHPVRPQPFRAGGTFEFSLPEARTVELCVFDTAGRRVKVLAHGAQPAGRHAASWDGRDASGRRVPAGVYFCRFASAAFEQTRRVVLVHGR